MNQSFIGSYVEDYNILEIDACVKRKLKAEKDEKYLTELKLKLSMAEKECAKRQTVISFNTNMGLLSALKKEIISIETGERENTYSERTRDLIVSYKELKPEPKPMIFGATVTKEEIKITPRTRRRLVVIGDYLEIASEYVKIDLVRKTFKAPNSCVECGSSLEDVAEDEDGIQCCPSCFAQHDGIIMNKQTKDGCRVKISTNSDDESIENFLKAFTRYQGLETDKPPDILYPALDRYFTSKGLLKLLGSEVRKMPLNERGRRGDTNHKIIWTALSHIGYSDYYEHANYIGKVYYGWELPNVAHLQAIIEDHYVKTQRVYNLIPLEERQRVSSLGTQFRLFKHLQLVGVECYITEFKVADNPESLRTHKRLWKLMCATAGLNDPDIYYIE